MSGLDNFTIDVETVEPKRIVVKVHRMYEHLPINADILFSLSRYFDTKNINLNQWSSAGCDTCDYGSQYETEFEITP